MKFTDLSGFSPNEREIIANRKANRIYVANFPNRAGKYISMAFVDHSEQYDIKLQISAKIEVRITYIVEKEKVKGVRIAKVYGDKIETMNLSTLGFEGVLSILKIFSGLDLQSISNRSIVLDSEIIGDGGKLKAQLKTILADPKGSKIITDLVSSYGLISESDIGNIAKKREALKVFENLFEEKYFKEKKSEWGKTRHEDVWQHFFEQNKWIFGYGLEYVFNAPINQERLEQALSGHSFMKSGKRPDGILKTTGLIQFMNIVEIKTHNTPLMKSTEYRKKVWDVSSDLTGAVSQCQQFLRDSIRNLNEYFTLTDIQGNRTSEEVFCFNPKCFLVIGDASKEFIGDNEKVKNPDMLSCFEYFRKNLITPEIITFDQLLMRAKGILEVHS